MTISRTRIYPSLFHDVKPSRSYIGPDALGTPSMSTVLPAFFFFDVLVLGRWGYLSTISLGNTNSVTLDSGGYSTLEPARLCCLVDSAYLIQIILVLILVAVGLVLHLATELDEPVNARLEYLRSLAARYSHLCRLLPRRSPARHTQAARVRRLLRGPDSMHTSS